MQLGWSRALQIVAVLAVAIAGAVFVTLALLGSSVAGSEPVGKLSPRADLVSTVVPDASPATTGEVGTSSSGAGGATSPSRREADD